MQFIDVYGNRIVQVLLASVFAVLIAIALLSVVPVTGLRSDVVLILKNSENTADYAQTSVGSAELLAQARIRDGRHIATVAAERVSRANAIAVTTTGNDLVEIKRDHAMTSLLVLRDLKVAFRADTNVDVLRAGESYKETFWIRLVSVFVFAAAMGALFGYVVMRLYGVLIPDGDKSSRKSVKVKKVAKRRVEKASKTDMTSRTRDILTRLQKPSRQKNNEIPQGHKVVTPKTYEEYRALKESELRDAAYVVPEMRVFRSQHGESEQVTEKDGRTRTYVGTSLGNVMTDGSYQADHAHDEEIQYPTSLDDKEKIGAEEVAHDTEDGVINEDQAALFNLPDHQGDSAEEKEVGLSDEIITEPEAVDKNHSDDSDKIATDALKKDNTKDALVAPGMTTHQMPKNLPIAMNMGDFDIAENHTEVPVKTEDKRTRKKEEGGQSLEVSESGPKVLSDEVTTETHAPAPEKVTQRRTVEPTEEELKERLNKLLRGEF